MQSQRKLRVSESEWNEWRESAVGQYFFNYLQEKANAFRQAAGMGEYKMDSLLETGQAYINAINTAEVCELICSLEFEDTLEEEINEHQTSGSQSIN